jgi:hypothetical protein
MDVLRTLDTADKCETLGGASAVQQVPLALRFQSLIYRDERTIVLFFLGAGRLALVAPSTSARLTSSATAL